MALEAPVIVGERPAAPPPAPTGAIQVSTMPAPAAPLPEVKKGSAMDRMRQDLGKLAKDSNTGAPLAPAAPKPADKAPVAPGATEVETPAAPEATAEAPPANTPPGETAPAKPGKVSPWKLYEAEKLARANAEKEIQTLKASLVPEVERKALTEKMTALEKRSQELEQHIQFVDYSKSQEYQDKYQKPYEQAWHRATQELKELSVVDAQTGLARPFSTEDMLAMVTMPLQEARKLATETFGDFANDIMAHRKEIKNLFEVQQAALTEARKNGLARTQEQQQIFARQQEQLISELNTNWQKINEEAVADPTYGKYFKPVEGNEEVNKRLEKGFALVDQTLAEDARDPRLTPEQRLSALKRRSALRNRAAAFGRLTYENSQKDTRIADLEKKLAQYEASTPATTGSAAPAGAPAELKGMDRIRADLSRIARP